MCSLNASMASNGLLPNDVGRPPAFLNWLMFLKNESFTSKLS